MSTTDTDTIAIARIEWGEHPARRFRLTAASARSAIGYRPPTTARSWGGAQTAIARFAALGDWQAQAATKILGFGSPYLTDHECVAALFERAGIFVAGGTWDDVHARTGPDPIRHSTAQRPITPAMARQLYAWCVAAESHFQLGHLPGLGWVDAALIAEDIADRQSSVHLLPDHGAARDSKWQHHAAYRGQPAYDWSVGHDIERALRSAE